MSHSLFINSCRAFTERLEVELEQIAKRSLDASTSSFHLRDIWFYFKSFIVHSPPKNVHPALAVDKSDTHEGKGSANDQPVMSTSHKCMESYDKK
jgi:hypothetical protein